MIGTLTLGGASALLAQEVSQTGASPMPPSPSLCLEDGGGFLRARLSGSIQAELDWQGADLECTGGQRPGDEGLRLSFSHRDPQHGALVIVFGMPSAPGSPARELPVNVTVIREGRGEFYSTQGEDKCLLDELRWTPLEGQPPGWRVQARGFCVQPARAVLGEGAILMSRFDFAGRIDLDAEAQPTDPIAPTRPRPAAAHSSRP